jgi:phosphomannomutase
MKLLKIGISGVRGIVGETIVPELVMDFACAFGTYVDSKKVLVGRDTRISGPMLHEATLAALVSTGCTVLDLGICPTPIIQYMVKKLKAKGAVSITAGHNDLKWNALTFINQDGTYLNMFQGEEVLDIYHLGKFTKVTVDHLGWIESIDDYLNVYFKELKKFLNSEAILRAKFKAVIDPCNGAGAKIIDSFSQQLGFELIPVNNEPNGYFPHDPEPRPRNAQEVASVIKIVNADVGFLLNSDASRVSLVAENGETLSEEFTLPLIANYYLDKDPGTVITNHSSSRMIEEVARSKNCQVVKVKVGQSYSIQSLINEDGVLAGEGSGGIAILKFQSAFDDFLTMGLILEIMAVRNKKISELIEELPRYHIVKEKIYCSPTKIHSVVNQAKKLYAGRSIDTSDGIKIEDKDGWVHVRASATEPMIRVIAEDSSKEKAKERIEEVLNFISVLVK